VVAEFDTSSLPKVKVTTFKVTNDCINEDGRWEGDNLIDTSECTAFTAPFHSCSLLVRLDASKWNTSKVREFNSVFYGCSNLVYVDVSSWDSSNVTNFNGLFYSCIKLKQLDLRNWNVSNGTQFNVSFNCNVLSSLIGGEDNSDNNISCLNGLKVNINFSLTQLDRASLRALINGLADLTGQTAQTLTLGATLMAKLTEEDIAIAVSKNWSIV
jgi:surface protein